eukprot:1280823-Rhodomonas_salina.2
MQFACVVLKVRSPGRSSLTRRSGQQSQGAAQISATRWSTFVPDNEKIRILSESYCTGNEPLYCPALVGDTAV